ncbi:hypothetical protein C9374_011964 [Naegleria lovaniensis]|uniref:Uncharacterized protein n=1 Tax=Naegleria lovaniensis TaxID=51637 RepID=A0AA88GDZ8_NAELO|nr:uncharacterized protein C9374_011964 [Naegleria lovaniensis]KAG2373675.1 hypothetical protein C9374_011964 [Naegleria lovaniensis]
MSEHQATKQFVPLATTVEDQEKFQALVKTKSFSNSALGGTLTHTNSGLKDLASDDSANPLLPNHVLPPPTQLPFASSLNREYEPVSELLKRRRFDDDALQQIKDPQEPELKGRHNFKILRVFSVEWFLIFIGCLGCIVSGVMPLVFYLLFGYFVDDAIEFAKSAITEQRLKDKIFIYTMGFVAIGVAQGISQFTSGLMFSWAGDRIAIRLRRAYFNALISMEIGFFDIKPLGQLTAPLFEDVSKIQDAFTLRIGTMITQFSTAISVVVVCTKLIEVFSNRINKATNTAAGIANEVAGCIKTVRSMAGDKRERARFAKALASAPFSIFGKALAMGISIGNSYLFINCFFGLTFWFGANLIIEGDATLGEVVQVFGIMLLAILVQCQSKELLKVLQRVPAIVEKEGGIKLDKVQGEITVEGIEFAYPSRPHITVLKDFNLKIKAGKSLALVGGSGSGKSTIIGLLERFYVPQKGRVLLDGVDISEMDTEWLHKVIGIVTQEPVLFQGTIKENIAYSIGGLPRKESSELQQRIEEAAKAANAHNFIKELPNGYNTKLGEKGVSLSGGQKQRIAIARAILQNPQILLLDEATSALDAESESLVQEALDRLMKGRTTICVAHRLATIKNSDEIVVMDHGRIIERGTHDSLVRIPNGAYRGLAEKQSMI